MNKLYIYLILWMILTCLRSCLILLRMWQICNPSALWKHLFTTKASKSKEFVSYLSGQLALGPILLVNGDLIEYMTFVWDILVLEYKYATWIWVYCYACGTFCFTLNVKMFFWLEEGVIDLFPGQLKQHLFLNKFSKSSCKFPPFANER